MRDLSFVCVKYVALRLCIGLFAGAAMAQSTAPLVSVVFAGDIMLEGGPDRAIRRGQDPFAGVAHLFNGADIRLGNLECVVATVGTVEPEKPNVFRVHPRSLKYVQRHFDAVGLANNHSGDYGPQAFAQMLGLLKKSGLGYYGGGYDLKEAHKPLILERQGLRIAILGYDEFQPRNFEADHDRAGVAWSEDEQVVRDIKDARRVWNADVVIPVMHWGWEEPIANARQRELARLMIDAGADAVIGGHPHQLQDTDSYKGKPIFYSLGNFVFEGFPDKVNNVAWVVRLQLDRQGVKEWQAHQVRIDKQGLPHAGKKAVQDIKLR
jgi:poly-gamma-glutamate synthesis protein (capsule biosynthesis protein)